jgi:hypothetical protein
MFILRNNSIKTSIGIIPVFCVCVKTSGIRSNKSALKDKTRLKRITQAGYATAGMI